MLSNMVPFVIEYDRIHVYCVCILHVFLPVSGNILAYPSDTPDTRIRCVSDVYPMYPPYIHLYPPSRPKYARICPRIRTVDSHSVGRKRGFVSIFVFFAEYIVNTRCIHTYLDVFRRNIREYELTLAETGLCRRSCQPSHRF